MNKCPYCYQPTEPQGIICFNCGAALQYVTSRRSTDLPKEDVEDFEQRAKYVNTPPPSSQPSSTPQEKKGFFKRLFGS
ncbi:MAG: hypothetical protein QW728_07475 [Thermoplasmata archaeon]